MDVVFVTHNELGRACLEELDSLGANIQAVFTRPQRDHISDQIDLATFTSDRDILLQRTDSINERTVQSRISSLDPDLLFVIGWSQLVDPSILEIPTTAALGMHPAPLPRGRGRAPIAWALIKGLSETSLSMFHLVERADAGDIVGQESISIDIEDDAGSLFEKVVDAGRTLIRQWYPEFEDGNVPRREQNDSRATWWPRRRPEHGIVDWTTSPSEIYNWIRGQSDPYPGAFSHLNGEKVTFWDAVPPTNEPTFTVPGEVAYADDGVVGIGAWEGVIEISTVQVSGDERIDGDALVRNYDVSVGDRFQNPHGSLQESQS